MAYMVKQSANNKYKRMWKWSWPN